MVKSEARLTADALKRKREREQGIVSQMIALYCKGNHSAHRSAPLRERGGEMQQMREGAALREQDSGERRDLCPECAELEAYAHARSERCPLDVYKRQVLDFIGNYQQNFFDSRGLVGR